jgi:hypothetical protein
MVTTYDKDRVKVLVLRGRSENLHHKALLGKINMPASLNERFMPLAHVRLESALHIGL